MCPGAETADAGHHFPSVPNCVAKLEQGLGSDARFLPARQCNKTHKMFQENVLWKMMSEWKRPVVIRKLFFLGVGVTNLQKNLDFC
jgi:hypothetical protein